jgi:hypothetical protein
MSKSTLKILTALIVAIAAALVTQPMRAGAIDTLVVTENSSTSLTAMLTTSSGTTSLSVNNTSSDAWSVALAGFSGNQYWTEPGAAGVFNNVQGQPGANRIIFASEVFAAGIPGLADGTTDTTNFTLNGSPVYVTFFDKGDVATVPDTGTTFSLFGLSLTGLGFLRRKLC